MKKNHSLSSDKKFEKQPTKNQLSIGIYGGAFDPPHNGHLHAIKTAINSKLFDEIWIVPSGVRPDKQYKATDEIRLMMVEALIADVGLSLPVSIKLFEVEDNINGKINGTVELFDFLKTNFKNFHFSFICGDELLKDLPQWKHPERLKEIEFVVVSRLIQKDLSTVANDNQELEGYKIKYIENKDIFDISSSEVRGLIKQGGCLDKIVPKKVAEIIKGKLYY